MILSHRHKFVYIAIPKTATHAIRHVLRPHMGEYDWEQCQLYEKKKAPVKKLASIGHGHITARQIIESLPDNTWSQYFSFCLVRNPYDRFLSYCYFINRYNTKMSDEPEEEILRLINDRGIFKRKSLLWPQHKFTHYKGEQLVRFIGRYECLNQHMGHILDQCNIPWTYEEIEVINKSLRQPGFALPGEAKKFVAEYYHLDFQIFGYEH